jgi:hypothetical protein
MSGKLANPVTVTSGNETDAGVITVWRMVGKMQFEFTNETAGKIRIKRVEVEPVQQASDNGVGIYLFSKDDLASEANLSADGGVTLPESSVLDIGPVRYEPSSSLEMEAGEAYDATTQPYKKLFFYVNETNATFTTINNQISLRFRVSRQKEGSAEWYDDELRYGMTTPYTDGTAGGNGFNVIRRNDWIHIPIHLTDWQFRVEPLAFVPIAGYPAKTVSSDGLTTTFSTGGYIILQPFAQKNNDGTWRDFTDPEVTFVSLTWKNSDGTNVAGTGKIFETAPAYDATTGRIVGVLNNSLAAGTHKTTITVRVKLGPAAGTQYEHAFTFNVILQK